MVDQKRTIALPINRKEAGCEAVFLGGLTGIGGYVVALVCLLLVSIFASIVSIQAEYITRVIVFIGMTIAAIIFTFKYWKAMTYGRIFGLSLLYTPVLHTVVVMWLGRSLWWGHTGCSAALPFAIFFATIFTIPVLGLIWACYSLRIPKIEGAR